MPEKVYPHELIRYIYNETSEEENRKIEALIFEDEAMERDFFELLYLKEQLDNAEEKPRESVVNNILHFSQAYSGNEFMI